MKTASDTPQRLETESDWKERNVRFVPANTDKSPHSTKTDLVIFLDSDTCCNL